MNLEARNDVYGLDWFVLYAAEQGKVVRMCDMMKMISSSSSKCCKARLRPSTMRSARIRWMQALQWKLVLTVGHLWMLSTHMWKQAKNTQLPTYPTGAQQQQTLGMVVGSILSRTGRMSHRACQVSISLTICTCLPTPSIRKH